MRLDPPIRTPHGPEAARTLHAGPDLPRLPLFLDDFGTGYASLQWLEALPFDAIKTDKSLVDRLPAPRATEMVKAVSSMASSLQLDCIAEGIETHEQARALGELGSHKGQGYLMARPMELEDWLERVRSGTLHFEPT